MIKNLGSQEKNGRRQHFGCFGGKEGKNALNEPSQREEWREAAPKTTEGIPSPVASTRTEVLRLPRRVGGLENCGSHLFAPLRTTTVAFPLLLLQGT